MTNDPGVTIDVRDSNPLVRAWAELCRWDPALPADSHPPLAASVVDALEAALRHPQPLAWGDDSSFSEAIEGFVDASPDLETAVGQLVCLREAAQRAVALGPGLDRDELRARTDMVIDRGILLAVKRGVSRLKAQALVDELTGLANRRALDLDLPAELARANRHGRQVAVAMLDLDGLKVLNDSQGHGAGDAAIIALARAIERSLREQDRCYRIGGDEFVLVLSETDEGGAASAVERISAAGAPPFSAGVRVTRGAEDPVLVLFDADRLLLAHKRRLVGDRVRS